MRPCTAPGPSGSRGSRGLSLLEMLVAVAVLALSMTLLHQVQAGLLRGTDDLATARKANALLRSILESREAVPAAGWSESGETSGLRWQVRSRPRPTPAGLSEAAPILHEVTIEITWSSRRGPGQLQVLTILPQAAPAAAGASG